MSCLLTAMVTGKRRVPEPPARTIPFMAGAGYHLRRRCFAPGSTMPEKSDRERARENLLRIIKGDDFGVGRGHPLPYGATPRRDGVNFSVFSRHATGITLVLFLPGEPEPVLELPLDPRYNRTGDVWHAFLRGLDPGIEYGYRAHRDPNPEPAVYRYDRGKVLIDPYGKAVAGLETWGEGDRFGPWGRLERLRPRGVDEGFEGGSERPLNGPLADPVLSEALVTGL